MTSWQLLALSPTARTHGSCWAKNEIENERFGLVGKKFSVLIEIKLKQNDIYCNDNKKEVFQVGLDSKQILSRCNTQKV